MTPETQGVATSTVAQAHQRRNSSLPSPEGSELREFLGAEFSADLPQEQK